MLDNIQIFSFPLTWDDNSSDSTAVTSSDSYQFRFCQSSLQRKTRICVLDRTHRIRRWWPYLHLFICNLHSNLLLTCRTSFHTFRTCFHSSEHDLIRWWPYPMMVQSLIPQMERFISELDGQNFICFLLSELLIDDQHHFVQNFCTIQNFTVTSILINSALISMISALCSELCSVPDLHFVHPESPFFQSHYSSRSKKYTLHN